MTGAQREQVALTFEPGAPGNIEELQSLIRSGMAGRYGGVGSDHIAKNLPNYRNTYEQQRLANTTGLAGTFVDYLAFRFGTP